MVQIDDKIISLDVFEQQFVCDLSACKGACCVEGDSGAPLENEEADILAQIYDKVKPFMREEGIREVELQGFSVIDKDGDLTTPLVNNKECAFVSFDQNGTAKCSIEQAYNQGEVAFKKPISCHLFPIRIHKYDDFEAVNYESIKICEPACSCGQKLQVPVYKFLKEPLIRLYGESWYHTLSEAAVELKLEPPFNNSSN
tara:strand:+ start:9503 stop:10099 length:597 start_codon:yes stop_codon:yes gene_type:complete